MRHYGHVLGVLPSPLAPDFNSLLTVDHAVVDDPQDLDLVAARRVCVKDDLPVLQKLVGDALPFSLADCSGAWRPLHGQFGRQFA